MLNRVCIALCASVLFLCATASSAQTGTGSPGSTRVVWPAVAGASGYIVEVKNRKGDIVFRQETVKPAVFPRLEPGEYKLRIIVRDTFMREASSTEWVNLSVIKSETPVFESIDPPVLVAGKVYDASIRGSGFMMGGTVYLVQGDKTIPLEKISVKSADEISCRLDLSKVPAGVYTIVIENPAGRVSGGKDQLVVSAEEPEPADIAAAGKENDGKTRPSSEQQMPAETERLRKLYLGVGYHASFVFSDWGSALNNSFAGADLSLSHSLAGLPFIPDAGWMTYAGLECKAGFSLMELKDRYPLVSGTMYVFPAGLGMYYTYSPFKTPLDFNIRAMAGGVYSRLAFKGEDVSGTTSSTDFFCSAGVSVRYTFKTVFFAEAGAEYQEIFYSGAAYAGISPFFRIGMLF
ncbi:MAG: hypothetical protein ACRCUT_02870 [Spirochaetota bacterium]